MSIYAARRHLYEPTNVSTFSLLKRSSAVRLRKCKLSSRKRRINHIASLTNWIRGLSCWCKHARMPICSQRDGWFCTVSFATAAITAESSRYASDSPLRRSLSLMRLVSLLPCDSMYNGLSTLMSNKPSLLPAWTILHYPLYETVCITVTVQIQPSRLAFCALQRHATYHWRIAYRMQFPPNNGWAFLPCTDARQPTQHGLRRPGQCKLSMVQVPHN